MKKLRRALPLALGAALALGLLLFGAYRLWERAPEPAPPPAASPTPSAAPYRAPSAVPSPSPSPEYTGRPFATGRQDGVYSILLAGSDQGNGCTDTIMLGRLDTQAHTADFVSIPRDTLINTDWEVRKLNSVYWGARNNGGDGISALQEHVRRLTGFEADCWAVLDLEVFEQVIDAMGGVWFDVPVAMDYEDGGQNLSIHLQPGYQKLDGEGAMGVCRFRSGYVTGDLGRIETQHAFLSACAKQFIRLGKVPNLPKVARILAEGVDTNLSAANIAWFLRQALHCRSDDVHFYTAPTLDDTVHGYSYAVLELEPWLEMVNEHLNPYEEPVNAWDLDLVYRSGGGYTATGTLRGSWYYGGTAAPVPLIAAPEPEEETEAPESEEEAAPPAPPETPRIITVQPGDETPLTPAPPVPWDLPEFALPTVPEPEDAPEAETDGAQILIVDLNGET